MKKRASRRRSVFLAGLSGLHADLLGCSLLQSEPEGFAHFHLYVCAAFLVRWRKEILGERDFQVSKCLFRRTRV